MPRLSASSLFSMIVTGMPTLAKFIAMPPPIVPAPITAARLISRGAHRAGTDHRRALDLARGDVLADARHLRGLALGKEDVALRLRLVAHDELHEQVALFLLRLVDR